MTQNKEKVHPAATGRESEAPRQPYIPQYKLLEVEPLVIKSGLVAELNPQTPRSQNMNQGDNPRTKQIGIRQPYAKVEDSPLGMGPVPNIGNNMEHMWAGVDEEIIDDVSGLHIDMSAKMIDNNDFVSDPALGLPKTNNNVFIQTEPDIESSFIEKFSQLNEGDYLLIVKEVCLCSGSAQLIQEEARLLVFGEHKLCEGQSIPVEDLMIIKRVPIKIGLFIDEV